MDAQVIHYSPGWFGRPATHRAQDFPEILAAMTAGQSYYTPYASTCSVPVPAEAHGVLKCDYCGTAVAVTIRGSQPVVTAGCPGCGAPLGESEPQ